MKRWIFLTQHSRKIIQFKTDGSPSVRASVISIWGPKALENIVDLSLSFDVETDKSIVRRLDPDNDMCVSFSSHTALYRTIYYTLNHAGH